MSDHRPARPDFPLMLKVLAASAAVTALAGALGVACSDDPSNATLGTGNFSTCEDRDGDGFGPNCMAGGDCDDGDPSVTDACYKCIDPAPGCPCDAELQGDRIVCGTVHSKVGDQVVCGLGDSVCDNGKWGECIINNTITLAPSQPKTGEQNLGPPGPCTNNPCDPECQTFNDTPTGLSDPDAGIVANDGGVSLPGNDGGLDGGSFTCTSGSTGNCAHSICTPGVALTVGCDIPNAPPPPPPPPPGGVDTPLFTETFANNNAGWTLGAEWAIGSATVSAGHVYGNADPGTDATPTGDNGVAGVVIGGNASIALHGYYYLTSPVVDTSAATDPVKLKFKRWLNSDYTPYMNSTVEVFNGVTWVVVWQNGGAGMTDASWVSVEYDISAYKNASMQVRFGHNVGAGGVYTVSGWNIDDVEITHFVAQPPPPPPPPPPVGPSCVETVCNSQPSCCSSAWTLACATLVETLCSATCINVNGACFACFNDTFDHDGDGYTGQDGDCADCDPTVNAGAYDFQANNIDEDCDGVVDDEPTVCDNGGSYPMTSTNGFEHAKVIDLCQTGDPNATGAAKTWGVLTAAVVQADGVSAAHPWSHGVQNVFGAVTPQKGAQMMAYSSGSARAPGQPDYVNPNGGGFTQGGNTCAYPPGFPKNAPGCPNGFGGANNSSGLRMTIRVPTNANSFSYNFNFMSSEYPEYVCTSFNDGYVALLQTGYMPANDPANSNNISFDSNGAPVSVNNALFTLPGCPTCQHASLTGTGFDGFCGVNACGGGTDWLYTTAPVVPGETITMHFSLWDTGDMIYDSTVLIDNWTWSALPAIIQTGQQPPPPPPTMYTDGWFDRDYDATGLCGPGESVVWGHWSWQAATPSDTRIEYHVRTATTAGGLDSAPEDQLEFTNPPGPAALAGTQAVAKATPTDTQSGSAVVDTTLGNNGRPKHNNFLRVRSHLIASTDQLTAPTLTAWNLQVSCIPTE